MATEVREITMFNVKHLAEPGDNAFTGFPRNRSGATAIEYALIAAIISIGIVSSAGTLGTAVKATYESVSTKVVDVAQ
jgi:pilus assembly protein Flp/PilA